MGRCAVAVSKPSAWAALRRPGRLIALASVGVVLIGLGLLTAAASRSSCDGPCPTAPVSAEGAVVADRFWFVHRDLGPEGSITVRLADMTGTITYPPPDHDEIVAGLVPWAKTGVIVKDGLDQGSDYAALMLTGEHGVRMQYGYTGDVAGSATEPGTPVWLRLTRSGDEITGFESADGETWDEVGSVVVEGLPETVQVGMFAASPGDLTVRETALGAGLPESRFTQAVGVFDHVGVEGAGAGEWASDPVGDMNHTDWEQLHNASGGVEAGGGWTVSGTGDIGPAAEDPLRNVDQLLLGLPFALAVAVVFAARFGAAGGRLPGREFAVRAVALGAAVFAVGAAATGVVLGVGLEMMRGNGFPVTPLGAGTVVQLIAGIAAALALCAVLAFAIGAWLRRRWIAVLVAVALIAVPYAVGVLPVFPDAVAEWLLRLTPAAGFAVKQTVAEYPQVLGHYVPSGGYFPLPWWAGLLVLLAYTAVAIAMAVRPAAVRTGPREPVAA
jgi:hypothetical protein